MLPLPVLANLGCTLPAFDRNDLEGKAIATSNRGEKKIILYERYKKKEFKTVWGCIETVCNILLNIFLSAIKMKPA
jgi:hypothetical protein